MLTCKNMMFKKFLFFSFIFLIFSMLTCTVMSYTAPGASKKVKKLADQILIEQQTLINRLERVEAKLSYNIREN